MTAAINPIFPEVPNNDWGGAAILTANTTKDLTAGTNYLVFTAGADGSVVDKVIVRPLGTNVATVMRFWLNNASTTGTAANNSLIHEVTMPATTVSEVAAQPLTECLAGLHIDPNHKLYVTVGTGVAAGFHVTVLAGDY